ncbi:MAG: DUF3099 domain-containing protein [Microbacterium sp.]
MKLRKPKPQSATSIDVSPEEDESRRTRNYVITMAIRTACVILAAVVHPYGWWTAVFAAGAIFLPYFAVVIANVSVHGGGAVAEQPDQAALEATAAPAEDAGPTILVMPETPRVDDE